MRLVAQCAKDGKTLRPQLCGLIEILTGMCDQPEIVERRGDAGRVLRLLGDSEILLEQFLRSSVISLADGDDAEIVQGPGHAALIPDTPRDLKTLLMKSRR